LPQEIEAQPGSTRRQGAAVRARHYLAFAYLAVTQASATTFPGPAAKPNLLQHMSDDKIRSVLAAARELYREGVRTYDRGQIATAEQLALAATEVAHGLGHIQQATALATSDLPKPPIAGKKMTMNDPLLQPGGQTGQQQGQIGGRQQPDEASAAESLLIQAAADLNADAQAAVRNQPMAAAELRRAAQSFAHADLHLRQAQGPVDQNQ